MSVLTPEKEQEIEQRIKDTLDDAVRFAEDSRSRSRRRRHRSVRVIPDTWRKKLHISKLFAKRCSKRCAAIRKCSCSARTSARTAARLVSPPVWSEEFGEARCLDTPISESAIVGVSIGASQRGDRPVAEMQFADFITCGFDQIVNQAATLRYRCGGR